MSVLLLASCTVLTLYVPGGPLWVAESSETVISSKCFGICISVLRDALRDRG
jgi:hypothetical protein